MDAVAQRRANGFVNTISMPVEDGPKWCPASMPNLVRCCNIASGQEFSTGIMRLLGCNCQAECGDHAWPPSLFLELRALCPTDKIPLMHETHWEGL